MNRDNLTIYKRLREQHYAAYKQLNSKVNVISLLRLLTVILAAIGAYLFTQKQSIPAAITAIVGVAAFFILMKIHQYLSEKRSFRKQLVKINEEEADFIENGTLSAENGAEYIDASHPYTSDLDIFGNRSLFQYLNRTTTYIGKTKLAQVLSAQSTPEAIRKNQEAIAEIAENIDTRQELMAIGRAAEDDKTIYERLVAWVQDPGKRIKPAVIFCCWILTVAIFSSLLTYLITKDELYLEITYRIFPLNMIIFFTQMKKIKQVLFKGEKIDAILRSYGLMLQHIQAAPFKSAKLQELQNILKETEAGKKIKALSKIYANLETMGNPFAMVIMNGLYFFHIHQLNKLAEWKEKHATDIKEWLRVIGEIEMLNSMGNMLFNNSSFVFPEINDRHEISFEELGHPLINTAKRINNTISFADKHFVILTGSNMSGKSTFLRTLGINMVLAGTGAPVCASKATIHSMPVLVSMRQSDSLADSESYFFAEVKRLSFIVAQLSIQPCFILLDEILRGTNSDDKRSGTVNVIEKIIRQKAFGIIATHDLEVCLTTEQHPDILTNKCFEVSIVNDELVFDYQLRDGICKNKSATFLMHKMGVI